MNTKAIDLHCDTLMKAFITEGDSGMIYDRTDTMVDIKRLVASGAMAQCFAIFILPDEFYTKYLKRDPVPMDEYIRACAKIFENSVAAHADVIAKAANAGDVEENYKAGKVSAILTMEDAVACNGDLSKIDDWYQMGVRCCSLTWNYANCIGYPNSKDPEVMNKGLTEFGKKAVKHMQEIGMLVDLSHASDRTFYDCIEICNKPIIATHSNCRSLSPHTRNMTDDMIIALAKNGGVMGINFGPEFLNEDLEDKHSTVARMVASAKHIREIAGIDTIALGSDFDGIGGDLEIDSCDKMGLLRIGLAQEGFTEEEIDKIFYKNALRVMKASMK